MIKSKKCSEDGCNNSAFSKGKCQKHSESKGLKTSNKKIKHSRETTISSKILTTEKRNLYFEYHISKCTHSAESGIPIPTPTRSNICHILPKRNHQSLEDYLENSIYLSFQEHERFDKLLFSHEFDKLEQEFKNSWENTCILIEKLLSLCEENTPLTRALKKYLDGRST